MAPWLCFGTKPALVFTYTQQEWLYPMSSVIALLLLQSCLAAAELLFHGGISLLSLQFRSR